MDEREYQAYMRTQALQHIQGAIIYLLASFGKWSKNDVERLMDEAIQHWPGWDEKNPYSVDLKNNLDEHRRLMGVAMEEGNWQIEFNPELDPEEAHALFDSVMQDIEDLETFKE